LYAGTGRSELHVWRMKQFKTTELQQSCVDNAAHRWQNNVQHFFIQNTIIIYLQFTNRFWIKGTGHYQLEEEWRETIFNGKFSSPHMSLQNILKTPLNIQYIFLNFLKQFRVPYLSILFSGPPLPFTLL
jgi:hypothetical protein